jgi:hypothetical protein
MQRFSNNELADIHFIYGYCNGNTRAAVREYQRRFPARRQPHRTVFSNVHRNLVENGSFRHSQGQGRPMGNYDLEGALNIIEENPQIALRPLANITNIPKTIVSIIHIIRRVEKYFFYTPCGKVQLCACIFVRKVNFYAHW